MSGGEQEAYRWDMRAHDTRPSVYVIEPAERSDVVANTPFGFAREQNGEPEPDVGYWEGQGL